MSRQGFRLARPSCPVPAPGERRTSAQDVVSPSGGRCAHADTQGAILFFAGALPAVLAATAVLALCLPAAEKFGAETPRVRLRQLARIEKPGSAGRGQMLEATTIAVDLGFMG